MIVPEFMKGDMMPAAFGQVLKAFEGTLAWYSLNDNNIAVWLQHGLDYVRWK